MKRQHAYKVRAAYRLIADWNHSAICNHPDMEHHASLVFHGIHWFAELSSWGRAVNRRRFAENALLECPVEAAKKAIERWTAKRDAMAGKP